MMVTNKNCISFSIVSLLDAYLVGLDCLVFIVPYKYLSFKRHIHTHRNTENSLSLLRFDMQRTQGSFAESEGVGET